MRRAVVTGAPGSGKSTLLAEVARRGVATGEEVARAILQAPGGMELRAERPSDFALAMLEAQRACGIVQGRAMPRSCSIAALPISSVS